MTTSDMVKEYNKLTGKSIKKFSSRAAAERQLAAARKGRDFMNNKRAESIANTWKQEEVAFKRSRRNGVLVDGKDEYRSVKAAFIALNLPLGKHIRFRVKLKQLGRNVIEGHEFVLI